jgi:hypothetical protein
MSESLDADAVNLKRGYWRTDHDGLNRRRAHPKLLQIPGSPSKAMMSSLLILRTLASARRSRPFCPETSLSRSLPKTSSSNK